MEKSNFPHMHKGEVNQIFQHQTLVVNGISCQIGELMRFYILNNLREKLLRDIRNKMTNYISCSDMNLNY